MPDPTATRNHPAWRSGLKSVRATALALLEWVAPPCCLLCRLEVEYRHGLCQGCWAKLPVNEIHCERCALPMAHESLCGHCQRCPPVFDSVIAPLCYQDPIDQMLCALKYHQQLSFARTAAGLITDTVRESGEPMPDLLIGVPMTHRAVRKRGLNQAVFLARLIGRQLGIPVKSTLIKKLRETDRQSTLNASKRQRNLKGAFHCKGSLEDKHIALVDDILTTGATANEISKVLKVAGANRVDIWVCARTPEVLR
ncbi:MAG: ComF family protein [Arenicellales bacterium]|jgi:ComF family protein|nr:ComF family protein [Arenicellales bacterium]MDP6291995.1 ComF family protein [Arenicellales bacterium]HJL55886.1 ComF family protein [Arenicellales bacterium]